MWLPSCCYGRQMGRNATFRIRDPYNIEDLHQLWMCYKQVLQCLSDRAPSPYERRLIRRTRVTLSTCIRSSLPCLLSLPQSILRSLSPQCRRQTLYICPADRKCICHIISSKLRDKFAHCSRCTPLVAILTQCCARHKAYAVIPSHRGH